MRPHLFRIASELGGWLDGSDSTAQPIIAELLTLRPSQWSRLSRSESLFTAPVVRKIIDRAHWLLSRKPQDAVSIALVAVRVAENAPFDETQLDQCIEIEADAWREYAHALLSVEDIARAKDAAEIARSRYIISAPRFLRNEAVLDLIAGQILHAMGDSEQGLILVEQSANLLLGVFDDKKKYVEGRIIHAKMLIDLKRYNEALASYGAVTDVAEELNDNELLAYVLNNVGVCCARRGDLERARPCLETAHELFENLGLKAEAIRPINTLVRLLVSKGRYKQAVSEYFITRRAYLDVGLPVAAARVSLKILQMLFLDGRGKDISARCDEMIDTFRNISLPREAMAELQQIHELAQGGQLRPDDVVAADGRLDRWQR